MTSLIDDLKTGFLDLVSRARHKAIELSGHLEVEIRLGQFDANWTGQSGTKFQPGVGHDEFEALRHLDLLKGGTVEHEVSIVQLGHSSRRVFYLKPGTLALERIETESKVRFGK